MNTAEIYVDGACRNNGHNNPQGGCGAYWGPFHPMNCSEKLQGDKQTNNRAELTAAIIGLSQAIKIGLQNVQIVTDSRYVKEGITKWIIEWKRNNWKTADKSAKKRRDVLNKDLWVWLDAIRSKLQVEWKWVEGHKSDESNLSADELAKEGISSESGEWQDYAKNLVDGHAGMSQTEQPTIIVEEQTLQEYTCKTCKFSCTDKDQSIQCQDCKEWVHYICTKLPPYQLYLYETTQRRYTCEICTEMDDDYQIQDDVKLKEESKEENHPEESKEENHPVEHGLISETVQNNQIIMDNTTENKECEEEREGIFSTDKDELNETNGEVEHSIGTEMVKEKQEIMHNAVGLKENEAKPKQFQVTNKEKAQEEQEVENISVNENIEHMKQLTKEDHNKPKVTEYVSIPEPNIEKHKNHSESNETSPKEKLEEQTIHDMTKHDVNKGENKDNTNKNNFSDKSNNRKSVGSNRQAAKGKNGKATSINTKEGETLCSDNFKKSEVNVSKELESFKKATIDVLQESFVNSFDQINNSIREMSCSQSDTEKLQAQVKMLTETNEKLKLQVGNSKNNQSCSKCTDYLKQINSLTKDLERSKEKMKEDRYNYKLEEEIRGSKFNAEISLLKRKEESMARAISIMETDISSYEKRLAVKSQLILDFEQNISKLNMKITNLQDTIFETKCQSFDNGENFHGAANNKNRQDLSERPVNDPVDKEQNSRMTISEEASTESNSKQQLVPIDKVAEENTEQSHGNENERKGIKTTNGKSQLKVEIVGTSNTKNLSNTYIGEKEFNVNKVIKYTIQQTKDYVTSMKMSDAPDVMILHPLCNEIEHKSPELCTEEVSTVIMDIQDKFKDMKIVLSLGLPRADKTLIRKIEKTNILLKEKIGAKANVYICDNANLFYRGQAQRGVLNHDGLHLTNIGTRKLGRNLKETLWDIFDLPMVTAEHRVDTRDLNINSRDRRQQRNDESENYYQQPMSDRSRNIDSTGHDSTNLQRGSETTAEEKSDGRIGDTQKEASANVWSNVSNDENLRTDRHQEQQHEIRNDNYGGNQPNNFRYQRDDIPYRLNHRGQTGSYQQNHGNRRHDGFFAGSRPSDFTQLEHNGRTDDFHAGNQPGRYPQRYTQSRDEFYAGGRPGNYGYRTREQRRDGDFSGNQPGRGGYRQQQFGNRDGYHVRNQSGNYQRRRYGRRDDYDAGYQPGDYRYGTRDNLYARNQSGGDRQERPNSRNDDYKDSYDTDDYHNRDQYDRRDNRGRWPRFDNYDVRDNSFSNQWRGNGRRSDGLVSPRGY